jgi:8-oxo-dGTP pyrophosphatase MutT (NUDIX family)
LRTFRQIAALPISVTPERRGEIFLVTSRGSRRWIIPKGNPIRGLSPEEVAAQEAFEEAGLIGRVLPGCIGTFEFQRRKAGETCLIDVYMLLVEKHLHRWDEKRQRSVLRCDVATALSLVTSESLAALIRQHAVPCRWEHPAAGL